MESVMSSFIRPLAYLLLKIVSRLCFIFICSAHLTLPLTRNVSMSEKLIHSFEGICPLTHYGTYGIKKKYARAVELERTVSCVHFTLASTCQTFPAVIKQIKSH